MVQHERRKKRARKNEERSESYRELCKTNYTPEISGYSGKVIEVRFLLAGWPPTESSSNQISFVNNIMKLGYFLKDKSSLHIKK